MADTRGSQALRRLLTQKGAQRRMARDAEVDQGYLSQIARGLRTPGLKTRQKLRDEPSCRIPMQWWDEPVAAPVPKPRKRAA